MVDNICKPKAFNKQFVALVQTNEKPTIQYSLISLKVLKTDRRTSSLLKYSNHQNGKEILLGEFLREVQKSYPHHQCSTIIKHQSEHYKRTMQLYVQQINEEGIFTIMFTDISEYEQSIKKDIALNLMNQLFRSFSHEFSTSLNCIQMLAQTILEEHRQNQQFITQYINPILNACFVLNSVVQDIKDFSMILQKNFALTLQPINLLEIISWIREAFSIQLNMKKVEFIVEDETYSHEVSSFYTFFKKILTDSQRVKQCILNLVQNAQKYTEQGHIKLKIEDETHQDKKFIKVTVEDTGVGMCDEEQRRVCEFLDQNQFNARENKESSFGIGLLISNQISLRLSGLSRVHGGGIHFESKSALGSKFWFLISDYQTNGMHEQSQSKFSLNQSNSKSDYGLMFVSPNMTFARRSNSKRVFTFASLNMKKNQLGKIKSNRLYQCDSSEEMSLDSQSEWMQQEQSFSKYFRVGQLKQPYVSSDLVIEKIEIEYQCICASILIVDDEFINIYALKLLLNRLGYKSDDACNGQEGFKKALQRIETPCKECNNGYYIIFMDIQMPVMNGFQATEQLTKHCHENNLRKPIIVACTAFQDKATQQHCQDVGMDFFLSKPVNIKELKIALNEFISKG